MSHPERIVPEETEPGIVALHLKRYEFARPFCVGMDVLDAGCGVGYGTAFLAEAARRVVGVDVDGDAIAYARDRYARTNVDFVHGQVSELTEPFDVACAFEVVEHVDDADDFVAGLRRLLRDGGTLAISTPRADRTNLRPDNPFHRVELSRDDFEALLRRHFPRVELYGQRRLRTARHRAFQRADVLGLRRRLPFLRRASRLVSGTPAMDVVDSGGIVIAPDRLDEATELVAVCTA